MKRMLFAVLMMGMPFLLSAQERRMTREERFRERFPYRYEVRIGYGGTPMYDEENFLYSGCGCWDIYDNTPKLDNLYRVQDGPEYVTGVFSAEFSMHLRRWFTLGFNLGINGMWGQQYDPTAGIYTRKSGASFNIMPVARFNWFTTSVVRMYSSVGLGVYAGFYDDERECTAAAMCAPVGITIGRKFFFFGETVLSTASFGGNIGIGYRF